jgi:hypothetical protein
MDRTLNHDPHQIFRHDPSPCGLYARKKWLREGTGDSFLRDFERTVSAIRDTQEPDGSWQHSFLETVLHLFYLHLTVRDRDDGVERGLRWLHKSYELIEKDADCEATTGDISRFEKNRGPVSSVLPFMACRGEIFIASCLLFMVRVFDWVDFEPFPQLFKRLSGEVERRDSAMSPAERYNMLRAYIIDRGYRERPFVKDLVNHFASIQTPRGDWGTAYDFYLTFNAIAHADSPAARRQVERAYPLLVETQNDDGSWGSPAGSNRIFATFLTVHALRNRGML